MGETDLISRQAAIDVVRNYYDPEDHSTESIEDRLKKLPTVQPEKVCVAEIKVDGEELQRCVDRAVDRLKEEGHPEVIRCKDCKNQEKFFQKDGRRKDGGYYIYGCSLAEGYSHVCLDDDYCSRAERRTDE